MPGNKEIIRAIEHNKASFDKLMLKVEKAWFEHTRLNKLQKAITFAAKNMCGFFTDPKAENILCKIAQKHKIHLEKSFKPNSTLHVMTQCYLTGGHTRVVESWIEAMPKEYKNDVILLRQKNTKIPKRLLDAISDKSSDLIKLKGKNLIKNALILRKTASKYENIILHTHMDDIIPVLAFGTSEFKRPVHIYNHADHLFWVGTSIADSTINLRTFSCEISEKYRGLKNNFYLPLPIKNTSLLEKDEQQIAEIKNQLKIPDNAKIVISMGASYKFIPFQDFDFCKTMMSVIKKNQDVYVLAIGPSADEPYWEQYKAKSENHIIPLGTIPYSDIDKYLQLADIAVDSFPFSSLTAFLDIAKYNVPCLSLLTPVNELDTLFEAGVYCDTRESLVNKILALLKSPKTNSVYSLLKKHHFSDAFSQNLKELYAKLPQKHCINKSNKMPKEITNFEVFIESMLIATRKRKQERTKTIKLCGVNVLTTYTNVKHIKHYLFDFILIRKSRISKGK